MDKTLETIKETTQKLLEIMGFESQIEISTDETGITVNIISPEGGFLIGQSGANLFALQHLIRLMVSKKLKEGEIKEFIIDINDYRKSRADILKELALDRAMQAVVEHRQISLYPMSAYERRIIHLVLADNKDVICESEGEREERHIVIKPLA